jgi:hypothetical protein
MSSRSTLILGAALFAVAATLAVTISTRQDPASASAPGAEKSTAGGSARFAVQGSEASPAPKAPRQDRAPNVAWDPEEKLAVTVDPQHPEAQQLAQAARQVEAFARQRLASMTRELGLSVDQQRRIFPKIVRASDAFHPAMVISGGLDPIADGRVAGEGAYTETGGAVNTTVDVGAVPLEAELDPMQQDLLVESSINDLMLWREIIAGLERRLNEETPLEAQPATAPAEESGGSRNLFDLFGPE